MVSAICAVVFTILQVVSAVVALKIKGEITEIKLHIAETRAKDREEMKDWADGRFIPRREAEVAFRRWQKSS